MSESTILLIFIISTVIFIICLVRCLVFVCKEKPKIDNEKRAKKELEDQKESELEMGKEKLSLFKASRDKLPSVIDSIIDEKRNDENYQFTACFNYNGDKLYELNRKFESLVASIEANVRSRPIVYRTKPKSAALHGGIASGLAGTGAGLYTALKTDQDNRYAKEKEDNKLAERKRIAKEADKYYNEIESVFAEIKKINKLHMLIKAPFLRTAFANTSFAYKDSYHTCYKYIDSSDENIQLCARAFAWYYYKLVNIEEYKKFENKYFGTYL